MHYCPRINVLALLHEIVDFDNEDVCKQGRTINLLKIEIIQKERKEKKREVSQLLSFTLGLTAGFSLPLRF